MRREVLVAALWTVVFAFLMTWLVAFAAHSLIEAQHSPTVTHYVHKFCPAGVMPGGK